jgi:hypothetical protein
MTEIKKLRTEIEELSNRLASGKYGKIERDKIYESIEAKHIEIEEFKKTTSAKFEKLLNKDIDKINKKLLDTSRYTKKELYKFIDDRDEKTTVLNKLKNIPNEKQKFKKEDVKKFIDRKIDGVAKKLSAINGAFTTIVIESDFGYTAQGNKKNAEKTLGDRINKEFLKKFNKNRSESFVGNISINFKILEKDDGKEHSSFTDFVDGLGRGKINYDFYYMSKLADKLTSEAQIRQWSDQQVVLFDKHVSGLEQGASGKRFLGIIKLTIHFGKLKLDLQGHILKRQKY